LRYTAAIGVPDIGVFGRNNRPVSNNLRYNSLEPSYVTAVRSRKFVWKATNEGVTGGIPTGWRKPITPESLDSSTLPEGD
jgi:hypothetical protein